MQKGKGPSPGNCYPDLNKRRSNEFGLFLFRGEAWKAREEAITPTAIPMLVTARASFWSRVAPPPPPSQGQS